MQHFAFMLNKVRLLASSWLLAIAGFSSAYAQPAPSSVAITVDVAKSLGPMQPLWAYFGYDEPNYTYMKDGQKLL
jgi:xylan 1,4-beta-xylosidase